MVKMFFKKKQKALCPLACRRNSCRLNVVDVTYLSVLEGPRFIRFLLSCAHIVLLVVFLACKFEGLQTGGCFRIIL